MSKFIAIDNKLADFAVKQGAKFTKDRPDLPKWFNPFEERRIDWQDDQIRKAVIIQPAFGLGVANSALWNFINIAWTEKEGVAQKPGWIKKLVDKSDFSIIENNIDELLTTSEENLKNIELKEVL